MAMWSASQGHFIWHTNSSKQFYKVMIFAQDTNTLKSMTYTWYITYTYDQNLPPMSPHQYYGSKKTAFTIWHQKT